jgi:cell shape-determining protein MreD
MRFRLFNIYTAIICILILSHIITSVQGGILTSFDYLIIIYIIVLEKINEDNLIFYSLIFGLFADFVRDGFYGPGIIMFAIFALLRFKADIVMDTTKLSSKAILYFVISFIYCFFSLLITGYWGEVLFTTAFVRSFFNIAILFAVLNFFKGIRRVAQNA